MPEIDTLSSMDPILIPKKKKKKERKKIVIIENYYGLWIYACIVSMVLVITCYFQAKSLDNFCCGEVLNLNRRIE